MGSLTEWLQTAILKSKNVDILLRNDSSQLAHYFRKMGNQWERLQHKIFIHTARQNVSQNDYTPSWHFVSYLGITYEA